MDNNRLGDAKLDRRVIKILETHNISKKMKRKRNDITDFQDYIMEYDAVGMTETWREEEKKQKENYLKHLNRKYKAQKGKKRQWGQKRNTRRGDRSDMDQYRTGWNNGEKN